MNANVLLSGIVLFVVFWAFQAGYFDALATTAWLVGLVIFIGVQWFIGKTLMPKPSADMKMLWMFAFAFAIVAQVMISYFGPYLGAVFPPGFTPSMLTPLLLSFWLIIFGGTMFIGGWFSKNSLAALIGVIWLLSSTHFVGVVSTGPNSWLHFGLLVSLPFILMGIMMKK